MGGFDMSINIPRGRSDAIIEGIIESLRAYEADHPNAQIDLYRQNPVSVRVRIIDPDFACHDRVERHKNVWKYLDSLEEETQSDISSLILLTPDETKKSFANFEFEDPVPSSL
jgi:stress-induced morphogen